MILLANIKLSNLIAPSFKGAHNDIKNDIYTHYWFEGGRGSTKSTFVSVEIILGIMKDKEANAVVIRRYGTQLQTSVYEQLLWAIDKLGVDHFWISKKSPLELIYAPTGQRIIFRGADEPRKLKSIKVSKGYIKYVWYEEVDELHGEEEIATINQSLLRGGPTFQVFYSYNPPKSVRSWVNLPHMTREDTRHYHSTYLTVPREWLGDQFLIEAEYLMQANYQRYSHEYLGNVTGTGGEVFDNVKTRPISDEEISEFETYNRGIDWGFAKDPFVYTVNHYDKKHNTLYIFFEYYKVGAKYNAIVDIIKQENKLNKKIIADNEPRSNAELRDRGLRVFKAQKGPDSRDHGFTWLQNLDAIIIDPDRCPNTAREFLNYEFEKDNNGNWRDGFPDADDHTMDATRYSLERYIKGETIKTSKR